MLPLHCDHQVDAEAFRGAVHLLGHLRHVASEVSGPLPTSSYDMKETHQLIRGHMKERTYKREPQDMPKVKAAVTECEGVVSSGVPQSSRRSAAKSRNLFGQKWETLRSPDLVSRERR